MAIFFWYPVKSYSFNVHVSATVNWTSPFFYRVPGWGPGDVVHYIWFFCDPAVKGVIELAKPETQKKRFLIKWAWVLTKTVKVLNFLLNSLKLDIKKWNSSRNLLEKFMGSQKLTLQLIYFVTAYSFHLHMCFKNRFI